MKIKIWNFLYDHRNLLSNICAWGGTFIFLIVCDFIFGETIDGIGELVAITIAALIWGIYYWAVVALWPHRRK